MGIANYPHNFHPDEDSGDDHCNLGEEEDEGPDRVDGGHAQNVRREHLEGPFGSRAKVVTVDGCNCERNWFSFAPTR
jgi:hypothetical protein